MADIGELNLKIRVNPDTGQLQIFNDEVAQLQGQVKDLTQESEGLNKSFTRPLENVGVHIFGHELLGAMGISQATRPILTLLSVGIREVGESFGVAATAAMPYVFGLSALAAVIYKVVESQKAQTAATAAAIEENAQSISSHMALLDQIGAYKLAVGTLTPELEKLRKETEELTAAELKNNVQKAGLALKTVQDSIKANEEAAKSVSELKKQNEDLIKSENNDLALKAAYAETVFNLTEKLKKLGEEHIALKKALTDAEGASIAAKNGYGSLAQMLSETTSSMTKQTETVRILANAEEELKAKTKDLFVETSSSTSEMMRKVVAEEETGLTKTKELNAQLVEDTRSEYQKKAAVIDDFLLKERESTKRHYDQLEQDVKKAGLNITAFEQQRAAQNAAIDDLVAQKRKQNLDVWSAEAKKASDSVASGFASACASSIVEGKNLEDELKNAFKSIAEQVIADLIRIEIQAAITANAVRAVKTAAILA